LYSTTTATTAATSTNTTIATTTTTTTNNNNNNNPIFIYLRESLTTQKPITKLVRVRKRKQQYSVQFFIISVPSQQPQGQ
jgi:hypothetical protein